MGKSLTFRGTVFEAAELMKNHRCNDPICDTNLWKVRHELDMAKIKMKNLEAELLAKGISDDQQIGLLPYDDTEKDINIEDSSDAEHDSNMPQNSKRLFQ